jgi:hypothetical protein
MYVHAPDPLAVSLSCLTSLTTFLLDHPLRLTSNRTIELACAAAVPLPLDLLNGYGNKWVRIHMEAMGVKYARLWQQ